MNKEELGAFGEMPETSVIISRDGVRFNPKLSAEDSDKLDRLTNSLKMLIGEFVSESGLPISTYEAYSLIADRLAVSEVYRKVKHYAKSGLNGFETLDRETATENAKSDLYSILREIDHPE